MTKKEQQMYYPLTKIKNMIFKFIEDNPEVYDNDEGQSETVWTEFDKLQDSIFSDNQTYFQWDVNNDTFRIDQAFASVLDYVRDQDKRLEDFVIDYDDQDHLYIFIELKD